MLYSGPLMISSNKLNSTESVQGDEMKKDEKRKEKHNNHIENVIYVYLSMVKISQIKRAM